jgi:inositol-pentakisphosphate 2-kinase
MRNQKSEKYVNKYCPLDLFSGSADRVQSAVSALWDAWEHSNGSVNNLKIFAGAEVVKPGQVGVDLLCDLRRFLNNCTA